MSRFVGAVLLGFVVYWMALGVGIPAWREGWVAGDAADCAVTTICAVIFLTSSRARKS